MYNFFINIVKTYMPVTVSNAVSLIFQIEGNNGDMISRHLQTLLSFGNKNLEELQIHSVELFN